MKNWKTSVGGILTSAGVALQASDDQTVKTIGYVLVIVGPLIIGLFGKDNNVTGAGDNARSL